MVVVPGWTEGAGWALLEASPFLRFKLVVAAADHGFCDGASHQRKDPYRQSPYDTAVFVLQTDAVSRASQFLQCLLVLMALPDDRAGVMWMQAARKWAVGDPEALERELLLAFAQGCPTAAATKRQKR